MIASLTRYWVLKVRARPIGEREPAPRGLVDHIINGSTNRWKGAGDLPARRTAARKAAPRRRCPEGRRPRDWSLDPLRDSGSVAAGPTRNAGSSPSPSSQFRRRPCGVKPRLAGCGGHDLAHHAPGPRFRDRAVAGARSPRAGRRFRCGSPPTEWPGSASSSGSESVLGRARWHRGRRRNARVEQRDQHEPEQIPMRGKPRPRPEAVGRRRIEGPAQQAGGAGRT